MRILDSPYLRIGEMLLRQLPKLLQHHHSTCLFQKTHLEAAVFSHLQDTHTHTHTHTHTVGYTQHGRLSRQTLPRELVQWHHARKISRPLGQTPLCSLWPSIHCHYGAGLVLPHTRHRHSIRKARSQSQAADQGGRARYWQRQAPDRLEGGILCTHSKLHDALDSLVLIQA
jgi:YD repeat-containing protein